MDVIRMQVRFIEKAQQMNKLSRVSNPANDSDQMRNASLPTIQNTSF